ncbi:MULTISPECIES: SusC/RagA family TonB-linked outer membrane protein [unclassified Sphingobacterium]|uniref:SusC/RagA family TonB-linked outer membrane protein n=1 Tax=unclassified Sphingobacterium TaxID=2609468 RepID=UPI00104C6A34|nr:MULTISPECIES: SusC/RagA family TonB-linked outer membrane protein [unclassified Sphingobacterium]MCS3556570.1 TonB-linked SusC/RagA family outer membrane protein [Sphingobacterium sp. JUb21]TCQ99866.1 TonB-linked SusC/RagA family outer membrane protein [Sphingobacterium sp. JUb20]
MRLKTLKLDRAVCTALLLVHCTVATAGPGLFTLKEQSIKAGELIKIINKQTGYTILYSNQVFNGQKEINVFFNQATIHQVMDKLLDGSDLQYNVKDETILINRNSEKIEMPSSNSTDDQKQGVSGKVTDVEGKPLKGATVSLKNKNFSTDTDQNGNFTLPQAKVNDVIEVRFVGYQTKEYTISLLSDPVTISLAREDNVLDAVVVTALGIKKSTRSLTYNIQNVKGEELTRNRDANFVNSLTGKIAGVTINSSSSGIGGATRVVMRGTKSITGNNNALYVIDGVPVLNTTDLKTNMPAGQINDLFSANTSSDIISMINPDDIESISTLTGAAAAALYGSQGQNGVIIINTKSGQKGRTSLSLTNNTNFLTPFIMPKFQNTYGRSDEGSYFSWGQKLNEPSSYRPEDFFQTGVTSMTGFTFDTGKENNQTFVSGGMTQGRGIIPNNNLKRYNFSFRNTSNFLDDKLQLDVNGMYLSQMERNMVAQGLYHNPIVPVYLFPPGGNFETIKAFERYNPDRLFPTQYWPFGGAPFQMQNPYWTAYRIPLENNTTRLLLGGSLKYKVNDWLNITGRAKLDHTQLRSNRKMYASTDLLFSGYGGGFNINENNTQALYGDLLANINKTFGDYTLTANIGGSRVESSSRLLAAGGGIAQGSPPNVFTTDNVSGSTGTGAGSGTARQPDRTSFQSLFGNFNISYKNMFFLDGSYRSDWYSQLYFNEGSRLFLTYPSVGISAILTEALPIKSDIMSYLKVRANFSQVGNPPRLYEGGPQVYQIATGSINQNTPLRYALRPERTDAWEAGFNFKFLKDKINLDVTFYNTNTYDQIFTIGQSATSGGNQSFLLNAGRVNNRGIEASLGYTGTLGAVNWNSNAVFTLNRNTAKELYSTVGADGQRISTDTINIAGAGSYQQKIAVGGNMSAIYITSKLAADQNGYLSLNPGVSVDNRGYFYAGNADPRHTIGFNNSFGYKNFNLSFLIFGRFGGVGVSATQAMLDAYGVSQTTAEARDLGHVLVNGAPYANVEQYYTQMGSGTNGVLAYYVYSATNIRLREIAFGYTIPKQYLGKWIKSINASIIGNNLFMLYNKAPFDPESTPSSGTYFQGLDYFRQPSLRSLGFSIKAQF